MNTEVITKTIRNGTIEISEYIDGQDNQHIELTITQFNEYVQLNHSDSLKLYEELKKVFSKESK